MIAGVVVKELNETLANWKNIKDKNSIGNKNHWYIQKLNLA